MIFNPVRLRIEIAVIIIGVLFWSMLLVYGVYDAYRGISSGLPKYTDTLWWLFVWLPALCTTALTEIALLWAMKAMWLYMYGYKLINSTLEAFDPVSRRRWSVDLKSVCKIRVYYIPNGTRIVGAETGCTLIDNRGRSLNITKALPIWSAILNQCKGINVMKCRKPWWIKGNGEVSI